MTNGVVVVVVVVVVVASSAYAAASSSFIIKKFHITRFSSFDTYFLFCTMKFSWTPHPLGTRILFLT